MFSPFLIRRLFMTQPDDLIPVLVGTLILAKLIVGIPPIVVGRDIIWLQADGPIVIFNGTVILLFFTIRHPSTDVCDCQVVLAECA